MIYNGHDYQPYASVVSLSTPGILYLYYSLGTPAYQVSLDDSSENVIQVDIDVVNSITYAFVQASYPTRGSFEDEVEIRIASSPAVLRHFSWTTIVGTASYSGPIWKDYIYQVPFQAPRVQYKVKNNGNDIYKGWCYETGQELEQVFRGGSAWGIHMDGYYRTMYIHILTVI